MTDYPWEQVIKGNGALPIPGNHRSGLSTFLGCTSCAGTSCAALKKNVQMKVHTQEARLHDLMVPFGPKILNQCIQIYEKESPAVEMN